MFKRFAPLFLLAALLLPATLFAQWKNMAPALLGGHTAGIPFGGQITNFNGTIWAGYDDVWMSPDTGKTWTKRSPFSRSDGKRVVTISIFDDINILVACTNGDVFISYDQGISWKTIPLTTTPFACYGSIFVGSRDNILVQAQGANTDLWLTQDGGTSWKLALQETFISNMIAGNGATAYATAGGPGGSSLRVSHDFGNSWTKKNGSFDWDSWSMARDKCDTAVFYVANEEIVAPVDNVSSVFVSTDAGDSWQKTNSDHGISHHNGSVTTAPHSVYVQTFEGIDRTTNRGLSWKQLGGPANTYDTRLVTALDDNIIFAVDSLGSIFATFNSGGDSIISTSGPGSSYEFSSTKIVNDSVGAIVKLPIFLRHTGAMPSVDMILHYPAGPLQYLGSFLYFGKSIDVSGSRWAGRAKLHFDADDLNGLTDSLVGYCVFKWFPLEFDCATLTFDSLRTNAVSCEAPAPGKPFTGIIGAYQWCGQSAVGEKAPPSHTLFSFTPNPAADRASLRSSLFQGDVQIKVYDMAGKVVSTQTGYLSADAPMKIELQSLVSGVYHLAIMANAMPVFDLSFIHYRP